MEHLPVEVVGNILSCLGTARDVVIASATCKKWREAFSSHLHSLSFNSDDWPLYRDLSPCQLEMLITQTIFQTCGLQGLTILMDDVHEFSASTVIAWLMYTRESLRRLHYNVRTSPNLNILDICGRHKLEMLVLAHNTITGVEPNYQRFSCLTSLSLSYVSISALDLSLLLIACPKIETLSLINLEISMSDVQANIRLSCPTLKTIYVEAISLDKFVLDADSLEDMHLKECALEQCIFYGKGTLKRLKIDDVSVINLDIGEAVESLEVVDVSNFTIIWPRFYQMISGSSNLKVLRLWDVVFEDEDDIVDLENIEICFPNLRHLSLSNDLRNGVIHYGLEGSYQLHNVVVLEVGWNVISDVFSQWVEELLEKCPNLEKLIIHGTVSDSKTYEECQILANFTSSIVRLMRQYIHVNVQFEYE